jgi:hypothetical protein
MILSSAIAVPHVLAWAHAVETDYTPHDEFEISLPHPEK